MEFENEISQGRKSQKKIIRNYHEIIGKFGVESVYMGKMRIYFLISEKCGFSVSWVRRTLAKYFNGEIKF